MQWTMWGLREANAESRVAANSIPFLLRFPFWAANTVYSDCWRLWSSDCRCVWDIGSDMPIGEWWREVLYVSLGPDSYHLGHKSIPLPPGSEEGRPLLTRVLFWPTTYIDNRELLYREFFRFIYAARTNNIDLRRYKWNEHILYHRLTNSST